MNPDPPTTGDAIFAGGEGNPAPDRSHDRSGAGHIECAICLDHIRLDEYRTARCWTDPHGTTCAAHHHCLVRVGERDLGLGGDAA
jgi:hypothetical protein